MKLMKSLLVSLALLASSVSFAAATEVTTTAATEVTTTDVAAYDDEAVETAAPAVSSSKVMLRKAVLFGAVVVIVLVAVDSYFYGFYGKKSYTHTAVDKATGCVSSVCGKVTGLFRRAPKSDKLDSSDQPTNLGAAAASRRDAAAGQGPSHSADHARGDDESQNHSAH